MLPRTAARRAAYAGALLLLVASCGAPESGPEPRSQKPQGLGTSPTVTTAPTGPRAEVQELLDERAEALEAGDRPAFRATVGGSVRRQLAWFDRLAELPLAEVVIELGTHDSRVTDPDRLEALVRIGVQLDGYDRTPIPSDHRMRFRRVDGEWRVVTDTTEPSQISLAPWEMRGGRAAVRSHVIVFTDEGSARHADRLADVAQRAVRYVDAKLTGHTASDWTHRVVVVAPSNSDALTAEGLGRDVQEWLGGLAFQVLDTENDFASRRVLLAAEMLHASPDGLEILLRHEFVHVATLGRMETSPTWLTEGLPEYVAMLDREQFYSYPAALRAAPEIDAMPADGLFHRDPEVNYALAHFALLALAQEHGADAPFRLLDAMEEADEGGYEAHARVTEETFGISPDELARQGAQLMLSSSRS